MSSQIIREIEDMSEEYIDQQNRELEDFTIEELQEQISESREFIEYCQDLISKKNVAELPFEGKYLKIREMDSYIYMFCDTCRYSANTYGTKCIYLKGVGFCSEFGDYEDDNYVGFATWKDVWMNYSQYVMYNDLRAKEEGGDFYTIVEITKEEYQNEFYKMIHELTETFEKWKQ